jgi:hypothetical protein
MSNSKETCSLVLKTSDITTTDLTSGNLPINNAIGSIDTSGQRITWKNINPQMLFGDMYDKFDKFNLNLACYSSRKTTANLADADLTFYMSGLQWSNQGYSLKTNSLTNKAVIFSLVLVNTTTTGTDTYGQNSNTLTFYRPNSNFDITIELKNSIDNYVEQVVNHQTFTFDIVGCDGYQRNPIINNQEIAQKNIDNHLKIR